MQKEPAAAPRESICALHLHGRLSDQGAQVPKRSPSFRSLKRMAIDGGCITTFSTDRPIHHLIDGPRSGRRGTIPSIRISAANSHTRFLPRSQPCGTERSAVALRTPANGTLVVHRPLRKRQLSALALPPLLRSSPRRRCPHFMLRQECAVSIDFRTGFGIPPWFMCMACSRFKI